jgi:hypothetical protein
MWWILVVLWTLIYVCKAITDAHKDGEKVIRTYLEKFGQILVDWYDEKRGLFTEKVNQGYPWSAGYWHFFDTIRNLLAVIAMMIAPFILQGWEWWRVILLGWLCFWIPSFTLVYHVLLMKNWTFKKWCINLCQIWR